MLTSMERELRDAIRRGIVHEPSENERDARAETDELRCCAFALAAAHDLVVQREIARESR